LKIKTEVRPPAVVRELLKPWFQFGEGDAKIVTVAHDAQGRPIRIPVHHPELKAFFQDERDD
jgi:hypothetical protein